MNLRSSLAGAAACALLLLAACATPPQAAVPMNRSSLDSPESKIGVAMTALPRVDTYLPGADCLLCLAAASIANSSLAAHAKTLPYEDLARLKEMIAELVRARGGVPVVIGDALRLDDLPKNSAKGENLARLDFSTLARKHGIDKLLLIDITQLGFERTYSAYFATSPPQGVLRGSGSLIDLKSGRLEWFLPLRVLRGADGPWDEPPKFAGLTNAYFQVIEVGKDEVLGAFKP